ncbi:MAG TPA: hypothetical protein VHY37_13750 [Tepidisphaeraceae bacterium]|jgi:hypothetical protein|nr:hypothetical protein [Tepidisphaeraceae bacterium]
MQWIIAADDDAEPLLGVTSLEPVGILVDAANKTLKDFRRSH